MGAIASFFSTPARQALGWTFLGLLGIGMAAGGVWFLTGDAGDPGSPLVAADADTVLERTATATPTPTRTPSPSITATSSPTASASEIATVPATATRRPAANTNSGTGGAITGRADDPTPEPTAEPTAIPEPTQPPVVAGGDYCASSDTSFPPNSVFGLFKVGGVDVPAGASVSLAFDGVIGPTRITTDSGGYRVDYNAGPQNCANRVGAAISVIYNGVAYPTGQTVGGGGPAIRADVVS